VLCLGEPSHALKFTSYMRDSFLDFPAPRGEVLLCPVSDDLVVPCVVIETRIGGDDAILVVHSDEPVTGQVADVVSKDPDWVPLRSAVAMRGDVLGVFLDAEAEDLMGLEIWPAWQARHTHLLISLGIIGAIPTLSIDGLNPPQICHMRSDDPLGHYAVSSTQEIPIVRPSAVLTDRTSSEREETTNVVDLSEWHTHKQYGKK